MAEDKRQLNVTLLLVTILCNNINNIKGNGTRVYMKPLTSLHTICDQYILKKKNDFYIYTFKTI